MRSSFYALALAVVISSHSTAGENNTNSQLPALQKRQNRVPGKWFQLPYSYPLLFTPVGDDGSGQIELSYIISGFIPPRAVRFTLELCTTLTCFHEKAFHFSVRLNTQIVIRTHKNVNNWAPEQTRGAMPFTRGTYFTLEIRPEQTRYKISVNGTFFTTYDYAVPKEDVKYIKVFGDVNINRVAESGTRRKATGIYYLRTLATGDNLRSKITMIPGSRWRFTIYLCDETYVPGMDDFPIAYQMSRRQDGQFGNMFLTRIGTVVRYPKQNFTAQDNFQVDLEILDGLVKSYVDNKYTGEHVVDTSRVFYQVLHGEGYSQATSECYRIP
ncbi:uncharacterized protein LOC131956719 [Physella acuta]|uniref:uncharacterized protein LOC131956719 n=1 Tax=Physella acuta TaxID=109671 RepID=UPI0027DCCB62|nr:uncharacterized protein LOC131956719 [Physella acuta]